MNKSGCIDCKKRYLGCHDRCKAYQDYRKVLESRKEQKDYDLVDYLKETHYRMNGHKHKMGQI